MAHADLAFLWDHVVSGRPLFPGAGFFEVAAAAASLLNSSSATNAALADVAIPAPMLLPELDSSRKGGAILLLAVSGGALTVQSGSPGMPTVHLTAAVSQYYTVAVNNSQSRPSQSLAAILAQRPTEATAASSAVLPSSIFTESGYLISPAVLDSCLQLGAVKADAGDTGELLVPAGVKAMLITGNEAAPTDYQAISRPAALPTASLTSGAVTYTDYQLLTSGSTPACRIGALEAKPLRGAPRGSSRAPATKQVQGEDLLYQLQWLTLQSCGTTAAAATPPGSSFQLGSASSHADSTALAISICQGVIQHGLPGLQLTTRGAYLPSQPTSDPRQAALAAGAWGVTRTTAQELPSHALSALDLSGAGPQYPTFSVGSAENLPPNPVRTSPYGCAVQGNALVAASLVSSNAAQALPPFHLMPRPRGALKDLQLKPVKDEAGPGQVLVAVKAVGINFRDVLNVLGMYPGDPGPPGGDCAGVVVKVGKGVTGFIEGKVRQACQSKMHATTDSDACLQGMPALAWRRDASAPTSRSACRPSQKCPPTSALRRRPRHPRSSSQWTPRLAMQPPSAPATRSWFTLLLAAWAWLPCSSSGILEARL